MVRVRTFSDPELEESWRKAGEALREWKRKDSKAFKKWIDSIHRRYPGIAT